MDASSSRGWRGILLVLAACEGTPRAEHGQEDARVDATEPGSMILKDAGQDAAVAERMDAQVPTVVDAAVRDARVERDDAAGGLSPTQCGACDRHVSAMCNASKTVVWECFRAVDAETYQRLTASCEELYTAIVRFCCPLDFATECGDAG